MLPDTCDDSLCTLRTKGLRMMKFNCPILFSHWYLPLILPKSAGLDDIDLLCMANCGVYSDVADKLHTFLQLLNSSGACAYPCAFCQNNSTQMNITYFQLQKCGCNKSTTCEHTPRRRHPLCLEKRGFTIIIEEVSLL